MSYINRPIPKAAHRHAVGYVDLRQDVGAKSGPNVHEHADGSVHNNHAVAYNDWANTEPDGWPS